MDADLTNEEVREIKSMSTPITRLENEVIYQMREYDRPELAVVLSICQCLNKRLTTFLNVPLSQEMLNRINIIYNTLVDLQKCVIHMKTAMDTVEDMTKKIRQEETDMDKKELNKYSKLWWSIIKIFGPLQENVMSPIYSVSELLDIRNKRINGGEMMEDLLHILACVNSTKEQLVECTEAEKKMASEFAKLETLEEDIAAWEEIRTMLCKLEQKMVMPDFPGADIDLLLNSIMNLQSLTDHVKPIEQLKLIFMEEIPTDLSLKNTIIFSENCIRHLKGLKEIRDDNSHTVGVLKSMACGVSHFKYERNMVRSSVIILVKKMRPFDKNILDFNKVLQLARSLLVECDELDLARQTIVSPQYKDLVTSFMKKFERCKSGIGKLDLSLCSSTKAMEMQLNMY